MSQTYIDCPRAKTPMTPCIARDGHLALDDPPYPTCVGCNVKPEVAFRDLAKRYKPARHFLSTRDPAKLANLLTRFVGQYVDRQKGGGR